MRRHSLLATGVVAAIAALVFSSCNIFLDTGYQTLRVVNATAYSLERVVWIDGDGYRHTFDPDQAGYLMPGSSQEQRVAPGDDYLYFYFVNLTTHYRTAERVTVRPFGHTVYILDESTPVVEVP
ncbi:hypothetical protein [Salinispira pacifica]